MSGGQRPVGQGVVEGDICRAALANGGPGFDDGVVLACAEPVGAHWLVTRAQAAFAHAPVVTGMPVPAWSVRKAERADRARRPVGLSGRRCRG